MDRNGGHFLPRKRKIGEIALLLSSSLSFSGHLNAGNDRQMHERCKYLRRVRRATRDPPGDYASEGGWQMGRRTDGRGRTRYENLHNTRNAFFGRFFCASALSPSLALARSSPFPEKYYNGVKRQMEYSVRPAGHVHCQAWSGQMQAW